MTRQCLKGGRQPLKKRPIFISNGEIEKAAVLTVTYPMPMT